MERRGEIENKSILYVEKTSRPIWGGALLIVAGLLNIGSGIGVTVSMEAIEDLFDFTGAVFAGGPMIFIGAVTLIAGIIAIMRRVWGFAIAGGILAVLPSAGWILGVPGLILVALSKPEFDFRESLVEKREVAAERVMATSTGVRSGMEAGQPQVVGTEAVTGMNTVLMQSYLKGLDYPASKNEINIFAKSNGAPAEVMTYMNRLPNREYNSPNEIEEEFSKIQ